MSAFYIGKYSAPEIYERIRKRVTKLNPNRSTIGGSVQNRFRYFFDMTEVEDIYGNRING